MEGNNLRNDKKSKCSGQPYRYVPYTPLNVPYV